MELGLRGKVVAIAGGTSGIGEAVALAFAKEGCRLAVCGRSKEKIDEINALFAREGFELLAMQCDVGNNSELDEFVRMTVARYGKLDVFINNAGATNHQPFYEVEEDEWYRVVNVNQKAVFFGCSFAAREMRKTGGGVIINTSSFSAIIPTAGISVYGMTKAAVDQMTKLFATELAYDNIRVVGVQPGMTVTKLTEERCIRDNDKLVGQIAMKRLAYPDDMIGAYLFLASNCAAYINGENIAVTGAKLSCQNPHYSYTLHENA